LVITDSEKDIIKIAEHSARGGYHLLLGNSLSTAILAIASIIIARLLGPGDYGLFSLVIVVPSFFIGLVDLGVTSAITRFSAKYRAEGRNLEVENIIKTGLLFELIVGICVSLFCLLFSNFLATYLINRSEVSFYVRIASILILLQTLSNTLNSIFIGLEKMSNNAITMIIRAITKISLSPLFIILGLSIFGALLGQITCYVVGVIVGLVILRFNIFKKPMRFKINTDILRELLKFGLPLYVAGILGLIMSQYRTIVTAYFASNVEIGNFQVTSLFATAMSLLAQPFTALFPAFSKLDEENSHLNQFFRRAVKYTAMIYIPLSVAIAVLSRDFVLTFFGPEYNLAPTFVSFSILIHLSAGLGSSVLRLLFNGLGRTDISLKVTTIHLLLLIPLAPLFSAFYGIMGVIAASILSSLCSTVYSLRTAIKKIKVSLDFSTSLKIYLNSIISASFSLIFLHFSALNPILNIISVGTLFFLIYLTLLPIIGIFNNTDIDLFRQLFHKIKGLWPLFNVLLLYESKVLALKQKFQKK
jgi:O-antigen/teichoic acid export membrane protein